MSTSRLFAFYHEGLHVICKHIEQSEFLVESEDRQKLAYIITALPYQLLLPESFQKT